MFKGNDSCLARARDDEPIFVLRAQDMFAPELVRKWAELAFQGTPALKIEEALACADAMEAWVRKHGTKVPD